MFDKTLNFENPANGRFYKVYLTHDLLGDCVLVKLWGSKNRRGAQQKNIFFSSEEKAFAAVQAIENRRLKRGYKKTNL